MKLSPHEVGAIAKKLAVEKLKQHGYVVPNEKARSCFDVNSPKGTNFKLKVTSLSSRNVWLIKSLENSNVYYCLVFKPASDKPDFHILTPEEMKLEKEKYFNNKKNKLQDYKNPEIEAKGLNFDQATKYLDKWASLPK